jgi:hypothetical protein
MAKVHDIAVLGATAAGYVAAAALARHKHTVVVVDAPAGRTESPLADWIPSDLPADCELLRKAKPALGVPFKSMVFHSADLTRLAEYTSRGTLGYLLRSELLLEKLDALARKGGVEKVKLEQPPRLEMRETAVRLHGPRELFSQLLLIAQDNPAEVLANLALPVRMIPPERMTVCGLDVPLSRGRGAKAAPALHVVAFGGTDMMGVFFAVDGLMHVRIVSAVFAPPATIDSLVKLISGLQSKGLIEGRLELNKAKAAIWHPPGGMALELETHLAKRTLLLGTAGGFASATTGQTLDPSVRSALVAADVAGKALHSRKVQETLWEYKNQWRATLAERIRPPGTSLQMLLPMVLSNKVIMGKFVRAFLYGQSL